MHLLFLFSVIAPLLLLFFLTFSTPSRFRSGSRTRPNSLIETNLRPINYFFFALRSFSIYSPQMSRSFFSTMPLSTRLFCDFLVFSLFPPLSPPCRTEIDSGLSFDLPLVDVELLEGLLTPFFFGFFFVSCFGSDASLTPRLSTTDLRAVRGLKPESVFPLFFSAQAPSFPLPPFRGCYPFRTYQFPDLKSFSPRSRVAEYGFLFSFFGHSFPDNPVLFLFHRILFVS